MSRATSRAGDAAVSPVPSLALAGLRHRHGLGPHSPRPAVDPVERVVRALAGRHVMAEAGDGGVAAGAGDERAA